MAALVWINGLPGTGKLTVTKTLGSLDESTIIVDNHSLIDPVAHRLGPGSRDHPRYLDERRASRKRAFDEWVHDPLSKTLRVVFTGR